MKLEELLCFDSIVILCHNDPDADAIASGYGLYLYFQEHHKKVRLVYGGRSAIRKSNLTLLVDTYRIPIEYVTELDTPELLLTVDCQYGEGNVHPFSGKTIAVIDHHQVKDPEKLPALQEIHSNYGSCSTLVWQMLKEAGYDVEQNQKLSTALYYGLYMDTSKLQEISHPMDKDMRDILKVDQSTLILLQNSNLSIDELEIVSQALEHADCNKTYRFAVVEAAPCDPNILGIISDMLNEVDIIDTCIAYCMLNGGAKLSVRTCVKEVCADELAKFVSAGLGSSGGHLRKAGGFLNGARLAETYENMYHIPTDLITGSQVHKILNQRMENYFAEEEWIDTASYLPDLSTMDLYQKLQAPIGFVKAEDIFPVGTEIKIRMLEGDFEIMVTEGIQIMIGIEHEIYPNSKAYFQEHYTVLEEPYLFDEHEYSPTVRDALTSEPKPLLPYAKSCVPKGESFIYARELSHRTKVFTKWDKDKYMLGMPGDYLAASKDDTKDVYIVKKEVFSRLYRKI